VCVASAASAPTIRALFSTGAPWWSEHDLCLPPVYRGVGVQLPFNWCMLLKS
jgi:hypothetical protein